MITLGECSSEELGTVASLGFLVMPSERAGEGVQVQCESGRRVWTGATSHGAFRVVGGPATFVGRHLLHLRLIRDAEALANMNGTAEILVEGDTSRVLSGEATGEMPLATAPVDAALLEGHSPTVAEISLEGLRHVLWTGTHDPADGFSEEENGSVGPSTQILFDSGRLQVTTSYAEVDCALTSSSWVAEVKGPRGAILVRRWVLKRLLGQLHFCTDTRFRVAANVERGGALHVEGLDWRLALPEAPTPAGRHYDELRTRLEVLDALVAEHPDGRLAVDFEGVEMMLQLLDGRLPIVRCTVHVVSDVERTPELLDEIDQQNEGRAFTKYFMSGNSVFAGLDVSCDQIGVISRYLRILADDSELLGGFLAALGAKAAAPTLW